MRRFEGRTVLVTGAARGQGRSHAVAFAREGADVAICDIARDVGTVEYALGTEAQLAETAELVREQGARVWTDIVDVRDEAQLDGFVQRVLGDAGKIDVAVANAGIFSFAPAHELTVEAFDDMVDILLKGTWLTFKAVLPSMRAQRYGRLIAIGSGAAVIGFPNAVHYVAAKHGLDGLVKTIALENAAEGITVNMVCPTHVGTDMIRNDAVYQLASPDEPTEARAATALGSMNAIPSPPWLDPADVSNAVLHVASEEAWCMTGSLMKIDMGMSAK